MARLGRGKEAMTMRRWKKTKSENKAVLIFGEDSNW
jgi:hypothetical protein